LAKLGQNVGKVLADREQQKQAQEMLPMFQQSMQDAMINANEGDSGLAFSKLMPFLTNPATLKNPYILPALDAGTKMIELAANDYARNIQVEAYRDRYSGGGGGGGFEVPTFEEMNDSRGGSISEMNQPENNSTQNSFDPNAGGLSAYLIEEDGGNLPTDEERGFSASLNQDNPFGFGFKTGERSMYVADEESRNKAVRAIQTYKENDPSQKTKVVDSITDTSNQPPDGSIPINIPGLGAGRLEGPSMEAKQKVTETTRSQKFTQKSGLEREQTEKSEPDFNESQRTWKAFSQNIGVASSMFKRSEQLRKIMEMAGGDTTQITTDDDVIIDEEGKRVPVKRVFVKGQDAGELSTERPMGADGKPDPRRMSEAEAVETIIDAPGVIKDFGWKFYPEKGKQPTAEAPAPTQAGIPANQLTTTAPEIPEEAMALQKLVEQGQVAKAGESAKNVEKRIKDIDAQIKQLSSTTFTAYSQGGLIPVGRSTAKTPEQAQADIQKIAQLKKQKNILQGKYSSKEEVGEALQSGLLTRAQAEAILKKQFKM
jgi:D-Tyr-tRNAtyr deacylase